MVPYPLCRQQALTLVQQLVLTSGGDDDMGTLLGLMHTAPTTDLTLKIDILKVSIDILKVSIDILVLKVSIVRLLDSVHLLNNYCATGLCISKCLQASDVTLRPNATYRNVSWPRLRHDVLVQSLLTVLKESHRTRTVFRRVGGIGNVMTRCFSRC